MSCAPPDLCIQTTRQVTCELRYPCVLTDITQSCSRLRSHSTVTECTETLSATGDHNSRIGIINFYGIGLRPIPELSTKRSAAEAALL